MTDWPNDMPTADWTSPDGSVLLYCGDCVDVLPHIGAAGGVDAIVTDPPYGISHPCNYATRGRGGIAMCNDYSDVAGDSRPFDAAELLDLGLPTILWGANHYADQLPPSSGWLVWDKERPDDLDQATCELAWTNCVKGVRRFRHLWNGCMRASEHGPLCHPTQKPISLMAWCLSLRWTAGFNRVADPYMGVGTTGVACVKLGRRFIGIEIDRSYFDLSVKRITEAFDSQALFRQHEAAVESVGLFAQGANDND